MRFSLVVRGKGSVRLTGKEVASLEKIDWPTEVATFPQPYIISTVSTALDPQFSRQHELVAIKVIVPPNPLYCRLLSTRADGRKFLRVWSELSGVAPFFRISETCQDRSLRIIGQIHDRFCSLSLSISRHATQRFD